MQLGPGAGEVVRGASGLAKLSLAGAHLNDLGAICLADCLALGHVTQLLELDLTGCSIGMPGLVRLLDVLEAGAAPALEVSPVFSGPLDPVWSGPDQARTAAGSLHISKSW